MKSIGVRLAKSGAYWQAYWYASDGRKCGRSLGRRDKVSRATAELYVQKMNLDMGFNPRLRDPLQPVNLAQVVEEYAETVRPRSAESIMETAGKMTAAWGKLPGVEAVSLPMLHRLAAHLSKQGLSEATVHRHLRTAKCILAFAKGRRYIYDNPMDGWRLSTHVGKTTYVPREWARAMMPHLAPPYRLVLGLARYSPLRCPSEIAALKWEDVDLDKRVMLVTSVKTDGKKRTVPIDPELHAMLVDQSTNGGRCGPVVNARHTCKARIAREFHAAIKAAGLEPWPNLTKSMRASAEQDFVDKGLSRELAARAAGHSPEVSWRHYSAVPETAYASITGVSQGGAQDRATCNTANGSVES